MGEEGRSVSDSSRRAVWHEYPVGAWGEIGYAVVAAVIRVFVGIVVLFVLGLVVGIANEEDIVFDVLDNAGLSYNDMAPFLDRLEPFLRMAIASMLALTVLCVVLGVLALFATRAAESRGLARAARAGSSRFEVPRPSQVEAVIGERYWGMLALLWLVVGLGVLFGGIALAVSIADSYVEGYIVGPIAFALAGLAFGGTRLLKARFRPKLRQRRMTICRHWTTEDEERVWQAARAAEKERSAAGQVRTIERDRRVKIGSRVAAAAAKFFGVAVQLALVVVIIWYPHGTPYTGAGERAEYSVRVESFLNVTWITVGAIALVSVAAMFLGQVVEGIGSRAERRALRREAQDAFARPRAALLDDYSERRTVTLADMCAETAGMLLVVGPSILILSTLDNDVFRGTDSLFNQYSSPALIATVAGIVLVAVAVAWNAGVAAHDRDLRNLLIARWPVLPKDTTESAGKDEHGRKRRKVIAARVGPALTPGTGREEYVFADE